MNPLQRGRMFICQSLLPLHSTPLVIKHYHGYLKLFREGPGRGRGSAWSRNVWLCPLCCPLGSKSVSWKQMWNLMTLRNFQLRCRKQLTGAVASQYSVLAFRLPNQASRQRLFIHTQASIPCVWLHSAKNKWMGSRSWRPREKKERTLLGFVAHAHEGRIFQIPKARHLQPCVCLPRKTFVFLAATNLRINVAGRTERCRSECKLSSLACFSSSLRTVRLEPPTPVAC